MAAFKGGINKMVAAAAMSLPPPTSSSTTTIPLPKLPSAEHIWRAFDTFLFDADGVLWREQFPLEGSIQLLDRLISAGKRVMIVTNNSTRDAEEHAKKCAKMGFKGLTAANIVCSGVILANHIKKLKASPQFAATAHLPVYLLGTAGLQDLLRRNGIESFGPGPDTVPADQEFHFDNAHEFISGCPVFAVASAFDAHISYPKIVKATNYLANPAIPFLVTNEDAVFPGPQPGSLIPGAGTVSSSLRYVSGREPVVMGKPSRTCWEYICQQCADKGQHEEIDKGRTIMIGDRLDTDILFGHNAGLATLLVLTGVTSMADVERLAAEGTQPALMPHFYAPTLGHLLLPNEKN